MSGTTSRYCRVRGTCLRIVEELTAERDQLRARSKHLEKEAGDLITQNDQLRARVAELEKENARLRAQSRTATGSECYQPWEE